MGGGGGNDGGYAARQQTIEDNKAQAREAVNRMFGVGAPITEPIFEARTENPVAQDAQDWQAMQEMTRPERRALQRALRDNPPSVEPRSVQVQVGTRELPDLAAQANMTGRNNAYDRVRSSIFDYNKQRLNDDAELAGRELKFALLRSGNAGGSLDIDQNSLLRRRYDKGVLESTNQGDAAANQARASDDAARLDLLSRIDAGMDQTSAIQGAANQLRTSGDTAMASARGQSIGNMFDNAGLLYQAQQSGAGRDDAARQWYERAMRSKVPGASSGGYAGTSGRTY